MVKLVDLIFLSRPVVLIPVWAFSLLGYVSSEQGYFMFGPAGEFLSVIFPVFLFSLSVGAVYIVNQIVDYDVDKENSGVPVLIRAGITQKEAGVTAVVLALVSLLGIWLTLPYLIIWPVLALILGCVYNFRPFYFTGRPFFDFLTNALGFGVVAFGLGWSIRGEGALLSGPLFINAFPYFLLMCAGSINSTLPDMEGDRKEGKVTTAVLLGRRRANLISILLLCAALSLSVLTNDYIAFFCAASALPLYVIYQFVPENTGLMEATYKAGGAVTVVLSGVVFPWILPLYFIAVSLTVIYFRMRFNTVYPSLIPVDADD